MTANKTAPELFAKLLRETVDGKIRWQQTAPPAALTRGTDDIFPYFFGAEHKGEKLGFYEKRFRDYYVSDLDGPRFTWETRIGFCIYEGGPRGLLVWSYERPSPVLAKLFTTVRTQMFRVEERLEALLK